MIEQPPPYTINDQIIQLLVKIQLDGTLKEIQDNYLYWNKVKYKSKNNIPPIELWSAIKLHRMLRASNIRMGGYRFSFNITDYIQRTSHQFDMNIGGILGSNIEIAETDKNKFMLGSIVEEAISSSQMEGANITRKKAKEMILQEKKPKNKSERMVMNNFITMKHIVQHKNENITPEGILYIHKLISKDTLEDKEDEGCFRDNDEVYVYNQFKGEKVYEPPPRNELEGLINDFCLFFNNDHEEFIHPIIKGCIIHFMIGWIHPFTDGNGRTARALFYWYMLKKGYWLIEYLSISRIIQDSKSQYENAYLYTEADENDLTYFITYHIKTMEKSLVALRDFISRKQKEVFQAAKFLKIPDVNDRMAQILKLIYEDPERILTTKEVESRFDISGYTARSDLKNLVALGFMESIQVNKKKRNFIRSENFDSVLNKYNLK